MRLLLVHADHIAWTPTKKALASAENVDKQETRIKDVLVVFTAVEKDDEGNTETVAANGVAAVLDVLNQVKETRAVLYPYAHLSSTLASPKTALSVLQLMERDLKAKKITVSRAPFGWYKAFDLKAKGHPLSELARTVTAGTSKKTTGTTQAVSEAVKKEEQLQSSWFVIDTTGKLHPIKKETKGIEGFSFTNYPNLQKMIAYEINKDRSVTTEPPHISLMKRLGLVGYEPGSDPGNLRFLPKGRLVKSLLEQWTTDKTIEYGGMEVETPIMYDTEHPALKSYLNRFPARQYNIQTPNKNVFLRFAACFGQFLMTKDANISYRNLPFRIYELTRYSFRLEQHGELAGLRRLRAFTMPDCHALVKDDKQAKEELLRRFELSRTIQEGFGFSIPNDQELAIRVVKEWYDKHKDFITSLVKAWGKPALLEMWNQRFFYFIMKYEWNFVDALGKAAALTTDQIDVENAERYGIEFTDADNKRKYPLILHLSPSGAIERVMYALLEKYGMEQKNGGNPVFPLWLAPTQVRLCPVNDSFIKHCETLADTLAKKQIRVDIDDRAQAIGKKIREAEMEWVNLIVVVGEKEKKSGNLAIRIRKTGKVETWTLEKLSSFIEQETEGKPKKALNLPRLLSTRATFAA
ncbi:MAG: threonine--tRNA ligase [Nanoarchaeota archaeon]|nr:threonine--tRNA ligase [Nanoarchaeota archaeon]